MKLAPSQNTLQPITQNVQPAVSQNVQRTATQADIQTIQNVQASQQNSGAEQPNALPITTFVPSSPADSAVLWVAIILAVLVVSGAIWLWKSF